MDEYYLFVPAFVFKPKTKRDFLMILRKRNNDREADSLLLPILANKNFTEEDTVDLLMVYLERGSDHYGNNKNEDKLLHAAVAGEMRNIIDLLMRKFSYLIDKLDDKGNSVTHHFIENERQKFFVEQSYFGTLNIPGYESAPLHKTKTIKSKTTSFVEWLIEKGFDFDQRNKEGKNALILSIEYNLQHITVVLLKHTREIHSQNRFNQSLLHLFLEKNAEYRDKFRSDKRKETWYDAYTLRHASDIVKILLDKGISELTPDIWNRSPVYLAIKGEGSTKIGELMINYLVQTKNDETKILVELMKSCLWWNESRTAYYLNILRNLTSNGANVSAKAENGTTPIYWAFYAKNREAVNFLNDLGVDFGVVTETGENLFHALAKKTEWMKPSNETTDFVQGKLVEFLASKGCCDINAKTKIDEQTPLHFASQSGNLAIVRKLIEHGAEVDCRNANQETPLHLAVHSHSEKVAEFLLENGADVNSKDVNGLWPIYYASTSREKPSMVTVLLKWGAYMNAKIVGESPFSRAIRYDCATEVREMLEYGGNINDDSVVSLMKSDGLTLEMRLCLTQHWFKLDIAKLTATRKYTDVAYRYDNEKIRGKRLAEIEDMKKTLIDNHTSLYDFIHLDFGRRRGHLNGEKLTNLIESPKLEGQFPEYAVVIRASYHETVMWKTLLEPAKRGWLKLTGILLPQECLEFIFAHLSNEDLVGMVEYDKYN